MKTIIQALADNPRVLAAYLLGSGVRGTLRPDSDLDIGLLPTPGTRLSPVELAEIAAQLTPLVGRPVDLGLISSANLVYARQAILTGQRILCKDPFTADNTVATLLGLAAQFDYERREVIHAYSAA